MATPIVMPRLGDFMTEGTITKWTKSSGDAVAQGEVIAEIETEKVNYDLEATVGGIFHPLVDEGAVVPVDAVAGYLLADGEAPPQAEAKPTTPAPAAQRAAARAPAAPRPDGAPVRSTPGARRLAAKLEVDIAQVTPTGPGGRVVEDDVRGYAEQSAPAASSGLPPGLPEPSEIVPMAGMRKSIAEHMLRSVSSTAQVTLFVEVDVTEAQRLRKQASSDGDLTVTIGHTLTKACAETLKRYPVLNSVLSDGKILHFDQVNVGVAVALKEGLIVPVVREADRKSIFEIAKDTDELVRKARDGKLSPDDVVGGTFTISILGVIDGMTPILSSGQSAILGVGRSLDKPVVRKGEVVVREMMTLSLTFDHQVTDGAVGAGFMRRLQQIIERPAALFK